MPAGPQLRDIHMPPAAGWWPLAPGWWVVSAVLLLVLVWLVWRGYRRRLPARRWQQACRELDALQGEHAAGLSDAAFAAGVSQLLRRAARTRDAKAASARGQAWADAMRELAGGKPIAPALSTLDDVMYRPAATVDAKAVAAAARDWLRRVLYRSGKRA